MYSYALHPWLQDPSGSTNYSKLANVSILHDPSPAAQQAALGLEADGVTPIPALGNGLAASVPQTFEHNFMAKNWNIVRVANGSLGLPVL
jgi:hypothetical protein